VILNEEKEVPPWWLYTMITQALSYKIADVSFTLWRIPTALFHRASHWLLYTSKVDQNIITEKESLSWNVNLGMVLRVIQQQILENHKLRHTKDNL